MIRVFENALSNELCEEIIKYGLSLEEVIPDSSLRSYTGDKSLDKNKLSLFDSSKKLFYSAVIENDFPLIANVLSCVSPRLIKFFSELEMPANFVDLILNTPPEFEEWKETSSPNLDTIAKMYSHLHDWNHCVINATWHDIQMWIDIKFLEMAQEMKIKYYGNDSCKCHKCQKFRGAEIIKKVNASKGYEIPKGQFKATIDTNS